ncbi:MAG: efflux RND transporter permease subunit [bacterium]
MLEKVIEWSVNNRFMVILVTLFVILIGVIAMLRTPVDAIPDLSDVQVIVFTEFPGQAPQVVEDQVTYPLTTSMLAVPRAKVVRGYSFFGFSMVYIIFEDNTDLYWARSRVLEYLNYVSKRLPPGVTPTLGPDATGVGWVYEYALKSDRHDLAQLRSIQDWLLRYELTTVPGVAEVASIGGYVKQYQVEVDPNKLLIYDIPLQKIKMAIKNANNDVGGRLVEMAETEFMVRGLGYIKSVSDLEKVTLGVDNRGVPITLKQVAHVQLGPELRRGLSELNGEGEVVGGIIVMRYGENALKTIDGVKAKLEQLKKSLPKGVEIVPVYDRSGLIERAIENLRGKLVEESIVVALVCIIFLLHFRSAFVAIFTLPVGILIAFMIMHRQGINANIMSLGGIAIAIGAMVDAAIVMIENAHKHIEHDTGKNHWQIIIDASKEVGPALFYSLLIITISFVPVFTLQAQEGRLFKPLAFTKTYAMAASALLAITIVPVLMGYFIRGKIMPEDKNPVNRFLIWIYLPVINLVLRFKKTALLVATAILLLSLWPLSKLGSEFMPPLYEGDLLYMPTTDPGISITKAKQLLQQTDKIIKNQFPNEVHHVFGKVGRAETATDPAPLSMMETTIMLKPEDEWSPGMTPKKLVDSLNAAIHFPGLTNAWTMPIKTRIDMLATGIKTPVGIKLMGDDLSVLADLAQQIATVLTNVPGTLSVFPEKAVGGNYLDFKIKRDETMRYGLNVGDVQDVIKSAIGGMNVTQTVEGLERYPVNVRYSRELRDNIGALQRVLISTPTGAQIPITQVADIQIKKGPPVIKSENSRRSAWIYVDLSNIDVGTYVARAKKVVEERINLPTGYTMLWSGQYEYMQRAKERMKLVVPVTLVIIFVLLFLNFKNVVESVVVMFSLPFALIGGIWLMYLLNYDFSVAVGVGFIALAGVTAEIGVIMLTYLDRAYEQRISSGKMQHKSDLIQSILEGTSMRLRPIFMTVTAIIAGLLPIMWGHGTGSDVMKRIAAPMVGGMMSSTVLTLLVIPAIYFIWKSWENRKRWVAEQK